ncbi:MAG: 2-C-methyl-D-erythritol 4-phosphate cytidylyltransferase, partial [Dehalococcoidia bacterium]
DGIDKLFSPTGGTAILARAIAPFQQSTLVNNIALVVSGENVERANELVERGRLDKIGAVCAGGARRQDSVRNGLDALGECDYVAVHDGCRPIVPADLIERGMEAAREHSAAVPGLPLTETVKETNENGEVVRTVDRSRLYAVQTPQIFRRELLVRAHREVTADVTDDAAMLEAIGVPVRVFAGSRANVKVTTPEDIGLVEALLAAPGRQNA